MSNYLAIATVTATIQRILQSAIQINLEGARVTTVRPSELGNGTPESGVNLFLYDIKHNAAWRSSMDSSTRRSKGEQIKPRVGIDLYYLLSFYGNDIELEPQRLLGTVISTLQERRILTKQMILDTIADPTFSFVGDSNLAEQVELITLMLLDLPKEERANIWSVFFQNSYSLSIVYHATVVLVEGEDMPIRALPVRDRHIGGMPFSQQPVIDRVVSYAGANQPILADSSLLIYGKRLASQVTVVRIGAVEATPQQVSETQISLPLSLVPTEALRAGVQSLQVVHQVVDTTLTRQTEATPVRYRQVESNVAAFVLRPTITEMRVFNLEDIGNDLCSAEVIVQVNLLIGKTQRAIMLLNEQSSNNPAGYSFAAAPREVDINSIVFAISDVKVGSYLVRLQVDGAESILSVDTNPNSLTFNAYIGPQLVIS